MRQHLYWTNPTTSTTDFPGWSTARCTPSGCASLTVSAGPAGRSTHLQCRCFEARGVGFAGNLRQLRIGISASKKLVNWSMKSGLFDSLVDLALLHQHGEWAPQIEGKILPCAMELGYIPHFVGMVTWAKVLAAFTYYRYVPAFLGALISHKKYQRHWNALSYNCFRVEHILQRQNAPWPYRDALSSHYLDSSLQLAKWFCK